MHGAPSTSGEPARALHAEIKAQGYQGGGYSRLTDFIRAWRQGEGQGAATNAFLPLAFELGEAFQFDWSEEGLVVLQPICSISIVSLVSDRRWCLLTARLSSDLLGVSADVMTCSRI